MLFLGACLPQVVHGSTLQLVGATCLWLASKYEEIIVPNSEEVASITDNTYTQQQLAAAERQVLKVLGYSIGRPNACTFLSHLLHAVCAEAGGRPGDDLCLLCWYQAQHECRHTGGCKQASGRPGDSRKASKGVAVGMTPDSMACSTGSVMQPKMSLNDRSRVPGRSSQDAAMQQCWPHHLPGSTMGVLGPGPAAGCGNGAPRGFGGGFTSIDDNDVEMEDQETRSGGAYGYDGDDDIEISSVSGCNSGCSTPDWGSRSQMGDEIQVDGCIRIGRGGRASVGGMGASGTGVVSSTDRHSMCLGDDSSDYNDGDDQDGDQDQDESDEDQEDEDDDVADAEVLHEIKSNLALRQLCQMARYLAELSLLDVKMARFPPSQVGCCKGQHMLMLGDFK